MNTGAGELRCDEKPADAVWETRTGIAIDIVRRPLTAFNDQPLSELAPICDVKLVLPR